MQWKNVGRSIQRNVTDGLFQRDAWFDYGSAAIGGALYPIIPTAIERVMGWDMSGWKGALTGLAVTSLAGLASGQAGMTCGAIGAFTAHMSYSVLNERVIYPIFGQYLFRWDPTTVQTFADGDELQEGAHMQTLPDGRSVPVYREEDLGADTTTGTLNDFAYSLPAASLPAATSAAAETGSSPSGGALNDYAYALPAAQSTLSGYVQTIPAHGRGFADADSYADAYM